MGVKFDKQFDKGWCVVPFSIEWRPQLWMYRVPASSLELHVLWWHFRWTFVRGW